MDMTYIKENVLQKDDFRFYLIFLIFTKNSQPGNISVL